MTQPGQYLQKILTEISNLRASGQSVLVVFDLDSTLFDVSPRLKKILHDFAEVPEHQQRFPESVEILKKIETYRSDWGIKNAVIRAGLDSHHPDFHKCLKEFWMKHFFSNEYLHFDIPYEGAVEFVLELWNLGADIVYLTGRDVHRMGPGSREILLKWGFPLDDERAILVLKPQKGMDDAEFKSDWFAAVPTEKYGKTWFFENEPVNVNLVRLQHQHVSIVFFESTHSGREEPPSDLPRVLNFLINKGGE
ncbi:MAG: HAD family hydrolase [Pseudobdellovibrionaceae bacterium]